ncbi:MAG: hypothetical protein PUD27_01130 [Solobacterium sp.]|nr:hypothetical protein [Solobacterium sp.]MDD6885269.1 hypothetical protein [Solobacterium sp.]MDY4642044.1 hypothetical protein [Erysipelotrichaceae bacterium]MDY5654202.1 hypothetical protein [Erysipelotrichaceae bacterium]
MNYTVIKVIKHETGSNCSIVINFKHPRIAHELAEILNQHYGSESLKWVVDAYAY